VSSQAQRSLTSRRVQAVQNSLTLEITSKAADMRAKGQDVVAFAAGEPDFDAPEYVKEAAIAAIRAGKGKYTAATGLPDLRKAVSEKFRKQDGFDFAPDEVICTSGAKHAIYNALYAVCNPGDEVMFPAPYWNSYPDMVRAVEAVPVAVDTHLETGYEAEPDAIRRAVTPKTRMLILNSPNNPTGAVYSRKTLESIAAIARETGLVILCDDIYEHLVYDGGKYLSILHVAPDLKNQVVVVNGLSKSHCMTGWRLGFAGGPREIVVAMGRFQSQATSHPSSITQHAAIAALTNPITVNRAMVDEFARRRDLIYQGLAAIPGVTCPVAPRGAFYVFPDFGAYLGKPLKNGRLFKSASDLSAALLEEKLVATIPGDSFGAPKNVRFSYTCPAETIQKGLERVRAFFAAL
jgi:aspartate aminotransferase